MLINMTTHDKLIHIEASLKALDDSITRLREQIKRLKDLGATDAGEWWKDGKYLYLVHPARRGETRRKREYIGSDPDKIKAAKERIERHHQIMTATKQLSSLEADRGLANYHIDHALFALRGIQNRLPGGG